MLTAFPLLGLLLALPALASLPNASFPQVKIAVIDTGADIAHPALRDHLWTNPGEVGLDSSGHDKRRNQIDDDQNGFVDDVHGWNFADGNNDLQDNNGHGTHIAGIIARSPAVQIMVIKALDPGKGGPGEGIDPTVRAIEYATKMGAGIINYSGGGLVPSIDEKMAIQQAPNILFVAAAGNERSNADTKGFYPASYHSSNILTVAAVNQFGKLLSSSNFGPTTVEIAAFGEQILSSLPGGKFGAMTGTSQATAMATQAASLIWQRHPASTPKDLIRLLLKSSDNSSALTGRLKNAKVVNALRVANDNE